MQDKEKNIFFLKKKDAVEGQCGAAAPLPFFCVTKGSR